MPCPCPWLVTLFGIRIVLQVWAHSSVTPAAGQQGQPGLPTILTGKWMSAIGLCFLRWDMVQWQSAQHCEPIGSVPSTIPTYDETHFHTSCFLLYYGFLTVFENVSKETFLFFCAVFFFLIDTLQCLGRRLNSTPKWSSCLSQVGMFHHS